MVGADTKIVQVQNKFPLKFKDVTFLKSFGETNTGETSSGELLSLLLEPFTFNNAIQIIKT
jgi:hypothetical protein